MALAESIHALLGAPTDIDIRAYDGSRIEPAVASAGVALNRPQVVGTLVRAPGELGLVRAYVSGDLDLTGDLFSIIGHSFDNRLTKMGYRQVAGLLRAAGPQAWLSVLAPPPPPPEERRRRRGALHSRRRDADAVAHHYDVSNAFYSLILGPSMTYSCAVFATEDEELEAAQDRKHELISTKLGLRPGDRLLDVGCGWGQMLIHAAHHHGVSGVGITLSRRQAELAAKRVAEAGLSDRIEIRLQDYRDINDGPYDAISSIGMFEHVGRAGMRRYAERLYRVLAGGGRLLNHAIARPVVQGNEQPPTPWKRTVRNLEVVLGSSTPSMTDSALLQRYVFPDGELHELGDTVALLEEVGLEVRHVEGLREHYSLTLRRWIDNLDEHWDEAVAEVGEGRARVWKLYMTACAIGFDRHATEVHQVLAVKPISGYDAGLGLRPRFGV